MEEGVTNTSIRDALGDMLGRPSTVLAPRIGSGFVTWPAAGDDRTLGPVELGISPT